MNKIIDFNEARSRQIIDENLFPLIEKLIPEFDSDISGEIEPSLEEDIHLIRRLLLALISSWKLENETTEVLAQNISKMEDIYSTEIPKVLKNCEKIIESIIEGQSRKNLVKDNFYNDILEKAKNGEKSDKIIDFIDNLNQDKPDNNLPDSISDIERTSAKNGLSQENVEKKLEWLIPVIIDKIIRDNNLLVDDLQSRKNEIYNRALNLLELIPNSLFFENSENIPNNFGQIKINFFNDFLKDYDIISGEYRPRYPLVAKNKLNILGIDAFIHALHKQDNAEQINIGKFKEDLEALLLENNEVHSESKYISNIYSELIEVFEIEDEKEKIEQLIEILFSHCILSTQRDEGRYEYMDDVQRDLNKIFFTFIKHNLIKLGYADSFIMIKLLKEYDFELSFEIIKQKYYDPNVKKL